MICLAELVERVTDVLGGGRRPLPGGRVEAHLADWDDCPISQQQMRLTTCTVGILTDEARPPSAGGETLHSFPEPTPV